MPANIRKTMVCVDETRIEMGRPVDPPVRRAVAIAVIANPYAGRWAESLDELVAIGEELGGTLGEACVKALGIAPGEAHSFGKAAIVGERGELEHAAAILHPKLGHKDAAFVRSHFDAIEARVPDAPRADEIVVAVAVTAAGRPHPRIGGLQVHEIEGKDGLR
jgi:hypothetical protein